jgi:hypothetical protein
MDHDHRPRYQRTPIKISYGYSPQEILGFIAKLWSLIMVPPWSTIVVTFNQQMSAIRIKV